MSRSKYILYISVALLLLLLIAFGIQIKRLQRQVRSNVRLIPSETKSRDDPQQNQFDREAATHSARPEVLVKFRAGTSEDAIAQITSRFNDRIQDEIEAVPGLVAIDDPDNADAAVIAAQYQALPEVEYAEPNYEVSLDLTQSDPSQPRPSDPSFEKQWALAEIQAPQAWATTKGSSEIVVAVLDTGVEYTHPDLVNNIWTRPNSVQPYQDRDLGTVDDLHGINFGSDGGGDALGDPLDGNGHGTYCAGIIGAECANGLGICGVNWKVQIMPLKFLNAGGFGTVSGAVAAINYAIDRKRAGVNLRIINASWGLNEHSRALEDVIGKANEAGILFIAAAGSANSNNNQRPRYPAGFKLVVSVAATTADRALAEFSNYGVKSVQLAAPGKDILTTALGNDYAARSGTSMAAPVVSGVAALALAAHPELSVDQLRSLLMKSVDKLPALRGKVVTGGRINAARAVAP